MSLSSESRAALDLLDELGVPPLDALPPAQARPILNELFKTQPEDQEAVDSISELAIPVPGGAVPARLYKPAVAEKPPVMVHFHGGGWVIGNLDSHDGICRSFANLSGCAVLAVEYRKAPEFRYPVAVDDCFAATQWIAANGASLGVDTSQLGVMGDSAGGNLAAATALRCRDAGGPRLGVQVLNYPAVDATMAMPSVTENRDGYFLTEGAMTYFWGHYLGDPSRARETSASPLFAASLSDLPPAYVVTAGFDPLRDEGDAYAQRLLDAGVEVAHECVKDTFHGFLLMPRIIADASRIITAEAAFARAKLGAC